jgi:hypothetical protein
MVLFLLIALSPKIGYSQERTKSTEREYVAYTVFYNVVPDSFDYPLIGFVNVANGNYSGLELGFVNTTLGNGSGVQLGFVNTTTKEFSGSLQLGFVNTTIAGFHGASIGFVNTNSKAVRGFQMGFVNTVADTLDGVQVGFVNTVTKPLKGVQVGFVNTSVKQADGFQLGFVNTAPKGIKGSQIGFVNVADSVSGIPVGFVSIVQKGGYQALEVSVNELYPVNLAFKIGVPYFCSYLKGAYNGSLDNPFALAFGFGSLIPLGHRLYFNPEMEALNSVARRSTHATSLVTNIRYSLAPTLQIAAGPSVTWMNCPKEGSLNDPFFSLMNEKIDDRNRMLFGLRASLSFGFTDL